MSQLGQTPSSSSGELPVKLDWPDFVELVLELTIEAYQMMRKDRIAQRGWSEDAFSLCLGENYIRPIAFDNENPIMVTVRSRVSTNSMREGKESTKGAKEIDLRLFDIREREYHKIYFTWEAKKLGDKRILSKYSDLSTEYINQGIYRFITCDYSADVATAGMLGYILDGIPDDIVGNINASMERIRVNPALSKANHLKPATPINSFKDVYHSQHNRFSRPPIHLYHLFLSFDFL